MDNPATPPDQTANDMPQPVPQPKDKKLFGLVVILILLIGIIAAFGIYRKLHEDARNLASQNNTLNSQIASLNGKIKKQQDINNGVVPAGSIYKAPAGKIGLLNGAITMTMPKGWTNITQGYCTGGTIDSNANCEDIAAIAPSTLIKYYSGVKSATWSVSIGVFDYSSSDVSAKDWFYTKYQGMPANSTITGTTNIFTTPVNGYSTYAIDYPGYSSTQAYYVIAHGDYAVVVSAGVQDSGGGFDYRTTYQPLINQMVQSIKFQG